MLDALRNRVRTVAQSVFVPVRVPFNRSAAQSAVLSGADRSRCLF